MTRTDRANAYAMLFLAAITPAYMMAHPRETLGNWRNGR